jgi:hypothetical protein
MKFAKYLILVNGILFVVFGLSFVFAPTALFEPATGSPLATPSAVIDVRATYGGLGLGTGIWFLVCFRHSIRLGLLGSLALFASIVIGRCVGLAVDGNPTDHMLGFLGLEVAFLLATLYALKQMA